MSCSASKGETPSLAMNSAGATATSRLRRLREANACPEKDAFYVRDLSNIYWLTAFEGVFDDEDAHALLVTPDQAILHTDSRYSEAARMVAGDGPVQVDDSRASHAGFVAQVLGDGGGMPCDNVNIEDSITLGEYRLLEEAFCKAPQTPTSNTALQTFNQREAVGAVSSVGLDGDAANELSESAQCLDESAAQAGSAFILRETSGVVRGLRAVKDAGEIERLKAAQAITDAAFAHIVGFMRLGMTEREVQIELEDFMRRKGAEGLAFSSIVATGPQGASPHAIPGDARLEAGQCVVLDFGARAQGYCSDMTRMVFLGTPDERLCRAYAAIREANEQVQAALRPGVTGAALHELAEQVLADAGFAGMMGHSLGHGVGIDVHEEPNLSPRNTLALVEGNVVTIEPGIYVPGEFGMRLEDFGVLTRDGFAVFTQSSHDMVII